MPHLSMRRVSHLTTEETIRVFTEFKLKIESFKGKKRLPVKSRVDNNGLWMDLWYSNSLQEETGMMFPVDLLADVSQTELEQLANNYMSNLLHSNPDSPEHLTLSDSTQVTIDISSVGFIPLYGSSDKQRILALFSPSDPLTAVALYLLDQWWAVDNILKTSDPARDGAMEVETLGERIVLYILNRVIYRAKEMNRSEELPFLCHGEKDHAKILWSNGEAVGFYSVKPSGSFCNSFSTRSYQLPVMDSIFVRKRQRGKGFGLQMLEDYVLSFKEDRLGLRYPLTKSMYKVCERYLCQYPGDRDLLWEVESTGGPNQRTNIACKIQAMGQSAVSKSLSFTEESLVITEMTQTDVVMEAITTQIKDAESMECTVEIVEEVTVLNATKEAEVPLTAQGRSGGSKQRKMREKIADDKTEKVIRIEDIEAETPRQDQVSAQADTELHNELVQTEGTYSVAPDEQGEDVIDTAPEEEAATIADPPATVHAPQDIEEADVTLAPATEKPQVQDDAPQDLTTSCDSQITVENVASEILETEEDTAVLVVAEKGLGVQKEAETLDKVGDGTQWDTDKKSEERVTQHEVSLPTHTSENGEAERTGGTMVKAIKTVQSKTPRRRSTRHSKQEEGVKDETTAQDRGIILRGRSVLNAPTPKRKYTRRSQKICEELEKEIDEAAEENKVLTTEVVELAVTEGEEQERLSSIKEDEISVEESTEAKQQLEDDELTDEVDTEKQQEPGEDDSVVKERPTELTHTAESASTKEDEDEKERDESEKEHEGEKVETSVIQARKDVSDNGTEEPPVVQKRALRIRGKVSPKPKPTKQSKRHQKQDGEDTDTADLGVSCSAGEEKADAQATDKQMEEHHQDEQKTVDKTEDVISTRELAVVEEDTVPNTEEATEDAVPSTVMPSAGVNMEESKEVQEEEEMETVLVMVAENEQEPSYGTASEIEIPDTVLSEAVVPEAKEPQEEDTDSEIPKLQKATVILVDIKTTCHHLSVKEVVDGEGDALGKQQEEKEQPADATAQTETEELEGDNNEKEKEKSPNVDEGKGETETVNASCESTSRTNRQEEEEDISGSITEGEVDEAETGTDEVEAEMESVVKDSVILTVSVEEKHCPVPEICADREADIPVGDTAEENLPPVEVEGAMSLEEEESPVVETRSLRSGPKRSSATPRCKTTGSKMQVDVLEAENSEEEETAVTSRTLRSGRISMSDAPKGKSRRSCKQIQEEEKKVEEESKSVEETGVEEEEAAKEAAVEKTEKEIEEEVKGVIVKKGKEEAACIREELDMEEGETVTEQGQDVVEEQSEDISKTCAEMEEEASVEECDERKPVIAAEEVELSPVTLKRSMRSGGKMSQAPPKTRSSRSKKLWHEEEEESTEKSTHGNESPVETRILRGGRKSVLRSHKQLQYEEGGPKESAEVEEVEAELGSAKEPQTEGDEGKAPEEDITEVEHEKLVIEVEKGESTKGTVTMTEDEENSAADDDSIQEGEVDTALPKPASDSSGITEEEKGVDDKEEAVTVHDREGGATQEEEAKSIIDEEQEATVTETKTPRSRKQAVEATPRTKLTRGRRKKNQVEEEDALESQEEEPAVQARVLRRGKKFIPVAQTFTTKRTHKQLQEGETEEDGGEESAAVEEREEEEGQQQVIDQEKEESLGGAETTEQVENLQAAMEIETAEEPVIQQDSPEEGQAQKTDEDTEASVEQHANEGKTLDVAEEAVTTQNTAEGEQSTSTCEGEILSTSKEDEAKGVSEEEEAPVIERVLRSGEKRVRATTRSTTTKGQDDQQEEDAAGEKSIEEDEAAVQTRVLRKGRRSAAATTRRTSKRARIQCQTDEEEEEETTPAEETGGEEEASHDLPEEEEGKSIEMEKQEEGESAAVGESGADSGAEQMKDVLSEEAVFEEKDNIVEAVDETGTDTVQISSAEVKETEQTQQQEEETPEEEEMHQLTDDSPRRSARKRPRVDYREEEEEGGETEAATDKDGDDKIEADKDKDTKKAKSSADDLKEKPDILKLVLDTDEKEEETGVNQEAEEDEQNMSEEEVEPVVIGKRVLRGRTVPSVIVTPQSKSTRASAEVQKAQIAASVEMEKGESAEGTVTMTKEEENTAADDDSVQEGDTDTPLPKPTSDSPGLPPCEDEATPSAEEIESDEMVPQLSDLQRVTVVLVDLQKTHRDFQEETAVATEGLPVQQTAAAEAEEEQREYVPESNLAIEKTELEKAIVEEKGVDDKVEAVTVHDREGGATQEEETKSIIDEEQEATVTETKTPRSRKQAVEATPRTKLTRGRQKKNQVEEEDSLESQEEEPAVQARVLRRGKKFIPVAQKFTTKRTHKQLQEGETEEDGGEESAAVEEREEEEGQQQVIDQEKEESLGGAETTEQVENLQAAMEIETAEEPVIQQDSPEEGQAQKTDEDTEASVEQHANEGKTLDVAEEAVTTQNTAEGEQSTSTCEGEILSTSKEDEAKGVSEEEEAPVIERVLRSGEKRVRATTRSTTTKGQDDQQEEDAAGEKSIEEDEAAVQTRVLRKGRRSAAATTRRTSKRARIQCQTDEEEEEETTPAEETGGEEEASHDLPEEEEGKSIEMEKQEEGESAAVGESGADSGAEQMKDVLSEEAVFEEKDNIVEAVDETGTDTVQISSAEVKETEQTQQQEEETPEEEEMHQLTDDSPRRSARKRPRVDYREEEEEGGETEAATDKDGDDKIEADKDKDTKKAKSSADDLKEKPDILKLVLDTDEKEEETGVSQEAEEDEQNMSEEEVEPVVIGKRVLRGRTVPSVIVTPQSKSTRASAEVQSLSDGQKSPQSAQKRKRTEVTPTRRSKRLSRV